MTTTNKVSIQALIDIIESNTDFRVIEKLEGETTLRLYDTDIKIIKEYYNIPCVTVCREDIKEAFSEEERKNFNYSQENMNEMAEKIGNFYNEYGGYWDVIRYNKDLMLRTHK